MGFEGLWTGSDPCRPFQSTSTGLTVICNWQAWSLPVSDHPDDAQTSPASSGHMELPAFRTCICQRSPSLWCPPGSCLTIFPYTVGQSLQWAFALITSLRLNFFIKVRSLCYALTEDGERLDERYRKTIKDFDKYGRTETETCNWK